MKLEIKPIIQKEGSKECGIICLQMLLEYYKSPTSYDALISSLEIDEIGTYAPQMGLYLLQQGFKVEITTLHPELFRIIEKGISQPQIRARISEKIQQGTYMKERGEKALNYFQKFIEAGGIINVEIPNAGYIMKSLDSGFPLIALLTSNFLLQKPKFNFHFNLIKGYDDDRLIVNDPLWDERGGEHVYKSTDLLFAIHASVYGDLDNGSLMKVWR